MPARVREIIAVCAAFGILVEKPKGGGSHWKAKRDGCRTFPIPASNAERTEIDDKYIRALCRNFDLSYEDVKTRLGKE
jgi:hypothetical protein